MSAEIIGLDRGLKELQDALTKLPQELQDEAAEVIETRTQVAAARIRGELSKYSQDLAASVEVRKIRNLSQRVTVKRADAHLVEYGTASRRTAKGWNRGQMGDDPIVGRTASDERRKMMKELTDIAKRGVDGLAPDRVEVTR